MRGRDLRRGMVRGLAWIELCEQPLDERPPRRDRHEIASVAAAGGLLTTEDPGEETHWEVPEKWKRPALPRPAMIRQDVGSVLDRIAVLYRVTVDGEETGTPASLDNRSGGLPLKQQRERSLKALRALLQRKRPSASCAASTSICLFWTRAGLRGSWRGRSTGPARRWDRQPGGPRA